jgi:hypothetical protein
MRLAAASVMADRQGNAINHVRDNERKDWKLRQYQKPPEGSLKVSEGNRECSDNCRYYSRSDTQSR